LAEKELEIKLDITKKSRKINRPVQFHDQQGACSTLHCTALHCTATGRVMEEVWPDSELRGEDP
jgi:hypothetical protein